MCYEADARQFLDLYPSLDLADDVKTMKSR